jgi:hypothetical protein
LPERPTAPTAGTVVSAAPVERVLSWLVLAVGGAAIGGLLAVLAGWLLRLSWLPLPGPVRLLGRLPGPVAILAGLAGGVLLGCLAERDRVCVAVAGEQLTVTRGRSRWRLPRASLAAVLVEPAALTAFGPAGELVRIGGEVPVVRLLAALREHGYPVRPGPP